MDQCIRLDLASELITEKIADLYDACKKAKTDVEILEINNSLDYALQQRDLILMGDITTIEEVLKERGVK